MSAVPFAPGAAASNTTVNVPPGNPVAPPAAFPFIQTLFVTGTLESTLTLPINTVRFMLATRDPVSQSSMMISFVPLDTFGANHVLLRAGNRYSEVDLQLSQPLSLYLRSANNDLYVEVLYWTT